MVYPGRTLQSLTEFVTFDLGDDDSSGGEYIEDIERFIDEEEKKSELNI